jgi:hypothetical protein
MMVPYIGQVVVYRPGCGEDIPGGHRLRPALVTNVGAPPNHRCELAVILADRLVPRTQVISRDYWQNTGCEATAGYWELPAEPESPEK